MSSDSNKNRQDDERLAELVEKELRRAQREKEKKETKQLLKCYLAIGGCILLAAVFSSLGIWIVKNGDNRESRIEISEENSDRQAVQEDPQKGENEAESQAAEAENTANTSFNEIGVAGAVIPSADETENTGFNETGAANVGIPSAVETENTRMLGEEIISTNAVLVDMETGSICAEKDARIPINPASMTKILTVLVAAEHVSNLDDTFTITREITDYSYVNGCSTAGFLDEEVVTVRDLFYGTVLPSGGEAALALAIYVAGSQEAFVELMNEKLVELGLSDTAHFTNCVGLYDENHYCSVYDMAMILEAAVGNDLCREILSAHVYTTSITQQHPEGIVISNWFLRRIEDRDTGGEVICGKTGYVIESGNCAASYAKSTQGKEYLCVTANATSAWTCIADQTQLYQGVLP